MTYRCRSLQRGDVTDEAVKRTASMFGHRSIHRFSTYLIWFDVKSGDGMENWTCRLQYKMRRSIFVLFVGCNLLIVNKHLLFYTISLRLQSVLLTIAEFVPCAVLLIFTSEFYVRTTQKS